MPNKREEYLREHALKATVYRMIIALGIFVLCITGAIVILPGITLTKKERIIDCQYKLHSHSDECYEKVTDEAGHEHKVLACGYADYVIHSHDENCYDEEGNLVCTLPEVEEHIHDDSCYVTEEVLTCGKEESEDHTHDKSCYREQKTLVCDIPEVHKHSRHCYDKKDDLICGKLQLEKHQHDDKCFFEIEKTEATTIQDVMTMDEITQDIGTTKASGTETQADEEEETWEETAVEDKEKADTKTDSEKKEETADTSDDGDADDNDKENNKEDDSANREENQEDSAGKEIFYTTDESSSEMVFKAGTEHLTVHVTAPEGAFPEGTTMSVKEVTDKKTISVIENAVEGKIGYIYAADITFTDANGNEIEPQKPIRVSMVSRNREKNTDTPLVVHVTDKGKADIVDQVEDNAKQTAGDSVLFDTDRFSVYAMVATTIEKTVLTNDGLNYKVSVTYGEDAGVPAGAELVVNEIPETDDRYKDYLMKTAEIFGWGSKDAAFARFFDISIMKDGVEIQPQNGKKVQVEIKLDQASALKSSAQVVHFGYEPEVLENVEVTQSDESEDTKKVSFDAGGFSIYAVVGEGETGDYARMTLEFYNGDNLIASMIVKNNDSLEELETILYDPGVGSLQPGDLFKGWTFVEDYTLEDANAAMSIKDVRQWAADKTIAEGETVKLYATLVKNYTVTYLDERGVSLGTDNVPLLASDTNADYTVNMGYTPVDDLHNFEGWNVTEGSSNISGYTPGYTYINGTDINISGNVIFSVNAPEGHWLVFNENGKGATYNAPKFIKSDETTSKPCPDSAMVRQGYTFGGWYTDAACTTPFTFGRTLTDRTTIYAKWTPKATADYTVIIWRQNLDGDGYDFEEAIHLNGTVGSTVNTVTQQGTGDNAYARINGTNKRYTGFHLKNFDQNVTIVPEGNAVVNVYYDRTEYTLTFQVEGYTYTPTTGNNGTQYGLVDGEYVQLTRHGWNNYYWTYGDTYWSEGSRYTGTRYTRSYGMQTIHTVTAKYEQDVSDIWSFTGSNGVSYPQTNPVTSWTPSGSSTYTARITRFETMPAENITFTHTTTNNTTRYFHYYVETVDGEAGDRSYNGRQYKLYTDLPNDFNIVYYNDDFWLLNGFTRQTITKSGNQVVNLSPGGTITWTTLNSNYGGDDNHLYFYYTRDQYTINYMDGVYVSGDGNPIDEANQGQLHESQSIDYQADISSYNKGGTNYYVPEKEGYTFEGWYIDSACTQPYTFSNMPRGGITVYAKWRQNQYRVFLHANTTDTSLDWGSESQTMNFRVSSGGKVSAPTGRRPGFEMVGWYMDPACTIPFDPDSFVLNDTSVTTPYDKTTDMTDVMDKFGNIVNPATAYNSDQNANRFWITRKLDLYAKWRAVLEGAEGIGVAYDANGGSNAPTDTTMYLDTANATAQAACTPPAASGDDPEKVFLYWIMQEWDEDQQKYVDVPDSPHIFPGDTFEVLKDRAKMVVTEWEDEAHTKIKSATYTVQLRAEYGNAESHTPTHIIWYANNGTGSSKLVDHLRINEAIDIEQPGGIFTREGYKFLGWARLEEVSQDGEVTSIGGTSPANLDLNLDESDLFLRYENGKFYATANTGPAVGTEIDQIAADERLAYHGMVAVWEKLKYTVTIEKYVIGSEEDQVESRTFKISYSYDQTTGDVDLHHEGSQSIPNQIPYGTIVNVEEDGEENFSKTYTARQTTDVNGNILDQPVELAPESEGGYKITANTVIAVTNTHNLQKVKIRKVGDDTEALPGAEFTLDSVVGNLTTGDDGIAFSGEGQEKITEFPLEARTTPYKLQETKTPDYYDGLKSAVNLTVTNQGISLPAGTENVTISEPDEKGVYTVTVTNIRKTGDAVFTKVDDKTPAGGLPGAVFALYSDESCNSASLIDTAVSADGTEEGKSIGSVTFEELKLGNYYYMKETSAPDNYILDSESTYRIMVREGENDSRVTVVEKKEAGAENYVPVVDNEIVNDPILVKAELLKTSMEGGAPLQGASFTLYGSDHETVINQISQSESDENGIISLGELETGTYYLHEDHAPDGYIRLKDDIEITVVGGADIGHQVTAMINDKPAVTLPDDSDTYRITAANSQGFELPSTGGSGTGIFYILGMVFLSMAGALCLFQRRTTFIR